MADIVTVTIHDETTPISREGFGLPLVFVPDEEVDYQEVEGTDDISGLSEGDMGYDMAAKMFEQEPNPQEVAIWGSDLDAGEAEYDSIADALDDLIIEHDDWYFLLIASRTQDDIEDAAEWAGSNEKLFVAQPDIDEDVSTIETMADNINSSRAALFAHDGGTADEDDYSDAAIVGRMAPTDPGSATWMFKQLNGVAQATYENADVNTLLDANVNTYKRIMGVTITNEGKETSGGYIDIQRGKDWLSARIEENIFSLLANSEKITYDDPGISQVVSVLKGVLKTAVRNGVIATDEDGSGLWTVDAPLRREIDSNDIANRLLPDIEFTATVAGAVHNVEVEGVLQV